MSRKQFVKKFLNDCHWYGYGHGTDHVRGFNEDSTIVLPKDKKVRKIATMEVNAHMAITMTVDLGIMLIENSASV